MRFSQWEGDNTVHIGQNRVQRIPGLVNIRQFSATELEDPVPAHDGPVHAASSTTTTAAVGLSEQQPPPLTVMESSEGPLYYVGTIQLEWGVLGPGENSSDDPDNNTARHIIQIATFSGPPPHAAALPHHAAARIRINLMPDVSAFRFNNPNSDRTMFLWRFIQ